MAELLSQHVESIRAKCLLIKQRSTALQTLHNEAIGRIAVLEKRIATLEADNERLKSELHFRKMVDGETSADKQQLREFLMELVREIDSCINDLNR